MDKNIRKIKYDGTKVRIEYEVKRTDSSEPDEFSLYSADKPAPEFDQALQALRADVIGICELPDTDGDRLTVRGVSLTYTDGALGACITALKALKTSNAPLVLNTPFLPSESEHNPTLSADAVRRIESLMLEADRYIKGERAQGSLLPAQDKTLADIAERFVASQPEGCSVTMSMSGGRSVHITPEDVARAKTRVASREAANA